MDLEHNFAVGASITDTWAVLTDVPRVARCMPGAAVDESTKDPYVGTVTVRVGAVTQKFRGTIAFAEKDDSAYRLKMDLDGRDVRGASGASALLTMSLTEEGPETTRVSVVTSLQLSGKVAQFGQAMLEDVSNAILQKFVANLENELRGDGPAPTETEQEERVSAAPPAEAAAGGEQAASRPAQSQGVPARNVDDDVLDLGGAVFPVLLRRYGNTVLGGTALTVAVWALARSFRDPAKRRRRRELLRQLNDGWDQS